MAVESQVLTIALGIYIGIALKDFFGAVSRDLVLPLLSPLASTEAGIGKLVINVGSIKINVGDLIVSAFNLLVVFAMVSVVLPYIKE
jgi:large-conductance mechanosensitive channel